MTAYGYITLAAAAFSRRWCWRQQQHLGTEAAVSERLPQRRRQRCRRRDTPEMVAWLIQHLLARDTAGADPRASTPELITWLIQNLLARDTAFSRHTGDDHGLSLPHPDAGVLVVSGDLPAELSRPDGTPKVVISRDHHGRWELVPASQLRPVPPAVG